jgi:hypothetical protein
VVGHRAGEAALSLDDLKARIDSIEEAYEFMLGYAAQGLEGDEGAKSGGELRRYLQRCDEAMTGLADSFREVVASEALDPEAGFQSFIDVLEQDVERAQAGLRLTRAQPSISSQLVDNLNASIHLRTVLTDVFLVDEIVKKRLQDRKKRAASS